MSIHYLIDPFTLNGDIIDVVTAESTPTDSTGATVVRVPDGVAIRNDPKTLLDTLVPPRTGLLTGKYDGLLASYAGFTQIVSDPCMNSPVVDSKSALISSGFVNHCITVLGGTITTVTVTLPFAPTQCVPVWEVYTFADTNDKSGRFQRVYTESDPGDLQANISLDGGANSYFVPEGAVFNVPVPGQGTALRFIFTSLSASRLYLGSWALIF